MKWAHGVAVLGLCGSGCLFFERSALEISPCVQGERIGGRKLETTPVSSAAQRAFDRTKPVDCEPVPAMACPVSFERVQTTVFQRRCGVAGLCHMTEDHPEAGLDLRSPTARANLVNAPVKGANRCAAGTTVVSRVAPGDPDHSMLWQVVHGTHCGPPMPLEGMALSCDEQTLVHEWIRCGAAE
jgi:hypothetical protein